MLQRTPTSLIYLSAKELGISERERAGLIEVRDDLASGRVKHVRGVEWADWSTKSSVAPVFNMRHWVGQTDCGTAHCIAGFLVAKGIYKTISEHSDALLHLFVPMAVEHDDLTVAQAISAIDGFLCGAGADCWPNAIA